MSILRHKTHSRRSAIAGVLSSLALLRTGNAGANQVDRPAPVDLGHGLEIRDYRLFPTEDVMRFIVEIHNTTGTAVDTPSVGVVLPHFDDDNFGWANPATSVLHPLSSGCLIGVAPKAVVTNGDWFEPEWMLCHDISHQLSESLDFGDIEFTSEFRIEEDTRGFGYLVISSEDGTQFANLGIHGLVWDSHGRLCGALADSALGTFDPGESLERWIAVSPEAEYIANPFALVDDVPGLSTTFSLQSRTTTINSGCNPVMPWET